MSRSNDRGTEDHSSREDVFDRLMRLPVLNLLEPFYKAHKEPLLYLFFGGLTFVVSIASYALFVRILKMDALVANVFSWILAVAFAYVTNRTIKPKGQTAVVLNDIFRRCESVDVHVGCG